MFRILTKFLNYETISYIIFGVLTTFCDFIIYYLLSKYISNYLIKATISFVCSVLFSFFVNKLIVFKKRISSFFNLIKEIVLFYFTRIFTLILMIVLMYLCVDLLKFNEYFAKVVVSFFIIVINYILTKFLVFKKKEE